MKIPHVGHHETIAHVQKSNDHPKIAANHETKVQENTLATTPKVNTSKIDFKA
jgi:hypothetical protein